MKRVVITGMGIVSNIGNDLTSVTDSLKNGKSGIIFNQSYATMALNHKFLALLTRTRSPPPKLTAN